MKIRNAIPSRQRIKLEGDPPHRDGFEPEWRGARELDVFIHCPADEPGVVVTSIITTGSVKRMNLREGDDVFAVTKATAVSVEKE
jgi:molybdopterin-binding protein